MGNKKTAARNRQRANRATRIIAALDSLITKAGEAGDLMVAWAAARDEEYEAAVEAVAHNLPGLLAEVWQGLDSLRTSLISKSDVLLDSQPDNRMVTAADRANAARIAGGA